MSDSPASSWRRVRTGRQGAWLVQGLDSMQSGVKITVAGSWLRREENREESSEIAVAVEEKRKCIYKSKSHPQFALEVRAYW